MIKAFRYFLARTYAGGRENGESHNLAVFGVYVGAFITLLTQILTVENLLLLGGVNTFQFSGWRYNVVVYALVIVFIFLNFSYKKVYQEIINSVFAKETKEERKKKQYYPIIVAMLSLVLCLISGFLATVFAM